MDITISAPFGANLVGSDISTNRTDLLEVDTPGSLTARVRVRALALYTWEGDVPATILLRFQTPWNPEGTGQVNVNGKLDVIVSPNGLIVVTPSVA